MQVSIQEILKKRIEASNKGTLKDQLITDRKEYNKNFAKAVQYFQKEINKESQKTYPFIVIRNKLSGIKYIEDLRWFYFQCLKYKNKKKGNTFNRCFFGALKIR